MRTVFMAYLTSSIEAVDFYCAAFNAEKACFKAADDDDFYAHAEIIINGQTVMAICDIKHCERECKREFKKGDNMEFWMTFDNEQSLNTAYSVLKEKAQIHTPLASCEWSGLMAQLTDKYGISWLLSF